MAKTLTLRIDEKVYRTFVDRAKADNRSVANFIENAALQHIQEQDFADDSEMAEILADEGLVKKLRKGSMDRRNNKGKMIG